MFKITIEGPGLNFTATGLGYGAANNIIRTAMEAQSPKGTRSRNPVSAPAVEPEPQPEPEPAPAEGGEPP
jgi:hypothetical protein